MMRTCEIILCNTELSKSKCIVKLTSRCIWFYLETEGRAYICPEDGVYPNYYNCTTFITCSNGLQYVMACPEGLIWNVDTNECDWPYNTECVSYPRGAIYYGSYTFLSEENEPLL